MNARPDTQSRRRFLALAGAASFVMFTPAVARAAGPLLQVQGRAFGTGWSVSLAVGTEATHLRQRLEILLAELDRSFSPWRADSAISRFNSATAPEMQVSEEIVGVTQSALAIAKASGGRFDPTVGPLVARFGHGPIHEGKTEPGGWRGLAADNGHIAKTDTMLTLDLCGIAKGHALDRMAELLRAEGHENFLIDLGGELAAHGRHPSGRAWHVAIEDPRPGADGHAGLLRLDGMTVVATSGDRANGYDLGGRRYSHIIDPATREPVMGALASVSVLMPAAREADGWATALMAASEAGPELARSQGIAALFLLRDGTALRSIATGSFAKHLV